MFGALPSRLASDDASRGVGISINRGSVEVVGGSVEGGKFGGVLVSAKGQAALEGCWWVLFFVVYFLRCATNFHLLHNRISALKAIVAVV
jgi:hypothetical protein